MDSTPSHQASGTLASTTARPTSPTMSTFRRRIRSTHAPAGSPISRNATVSQAARMPTSSADALSASTATSGNARTLICEPNWLIVSAINNWRKSCSRSKPQRRRVIGSSACSVSVTQSPLATPVAVSTLGLAQLGAKDRRLVTVGEGDDLDEVEAATAVEVNGSAARGDPHLVESRIGGPLQEPGH